MVFEKPKWIVVLEGILDLPPLLCALGILIRLRRRRNTRLETWTIRRQCMRHRT